MNGHVDSFGRALVTVSIRPSDAAATHEIQVWIDTAFNGDLVLPQQQIDDLALPPSGTVKAILADGSEIALQRYTCLIDWLGEGKGDILLFCKSRTSPLSFLFFDDHDSGLKWRVDVARPITQVSHDMI